LVGEIGIDFSDLKKALVRGRKMYTASLQK